MLKSLVLTPYILLDVVASCSVLHVANRLLEAGKTWYECSSSRRVIAAQDMRRCRVYTVFNLYVSTSCLLGLYVTCLPWRRLIIFTLALCGVSREKTRAAESYASLSASATQSI
jgi:hypothetical protein